MAKLSPHEMDRCILAFEEFAGNRPDHWGSFDRESWRIVSQGAPRQGEYADQLLQQLWEAFLAGCQFAPAPAPASAPAMTGDRAAGDAGEKHG
jgi:hypothetical protein